MKQSPAQGTHEAVAWPRACTKRLPGAGHARGVRLAQGMHEKVTWRRARAKRLPGSWHARNGYLAQGTHEAVAWLKACTNGYLAQGMHKTVTWRRAARWAFAHRASGVGLRSFVLLIMAPSRPALGLLSPL